MCESMTTAAADTNYPHWHGGRLQRCEWEDSSVFRSRPASEAGRCRHRHISGYTVGQVIDDYLRGFQGRSRAETKQIIHHRIWPKLAGHPWPR